MPTSVSERLAAVRQALTDRDLTALIVTTGDPHMSEYLPENWALRRYLTGFTGSAGTLIVTADKALLWTDSRYWDQAARETAGTGITVMQAGKEDVPTPRAWLAMNLADDSGTLGNRDGREIRNGRRHGRFDRPPLAGTPGALRRSRARLHVGTETRC